MRRKPYTEIGIKRVPCIRCGASSHQQWQICSLNNEYKGLCTPCDLALNSLVLEFIGIPAKERFCLMDDYESNLNDS